MNSDKNSVPKGSHNHRKTPNDLFATLFPLVIHEWGNALHVALFSWSKIQENLNKAGVPAVVNETWAPKLGKSLERLDSSLRSLREELLLRQNVHDISLKDASDEALRLVRQVVVSEVPNRWIVEFPESVGDMRSSHLGVGRWEFIAEVFYIYEVLVLRIADPVEDFKITLRWGVQSNGHPRLDVIGKEEAIQSDIDRVGRWHKIKSELHHDAIEAWRMVATEEI
jgi:hypothetical protein